MVRLDTKKKKPFLLKLIIFFLAIIAIMGWLRVYQSIYQWQTLQEFNIQPGPWYSLITGILIGIVSSVAVFGAWLRLVWSEIFVKISSVVIILGWWLDYLLFTQNQTAFYNWPFRIFASILFLGFVFGYYYIERKRK